MRRSEELALEFLLGKIEQNGRTYLKPNSEREKQARAATARVLRKEAGRTGYFTHLVASLINPSPNNVFIKRKIIFQRPRGTPARILDREQAKIAAFMQKELKKQKANTAPTDAQRRNLKPMMAMTKEKFGISNRKIWDIWKEFGPPSIAETPTPALRRSPRRG
jgi:hypothetical protein